MCKYKIVDIDSNTWNKTRLSAVRVYENENVNKTLLWLLCICDLNKRWGSKNIYDLICKEIKGKYEVKNTNELTKQQIRKYKIDTARLFKDSKHSMYVHEDTANGIIMQSRLSNSKTIKFRADLGFNQINLILQKEQSAAIPLLKAFSPEKIELQHNILKNERVRTDMYLFESKFVVEIDKKGHIDRNQNEENKRKITIEKYSDCKFVHRINTDVEGFDIFHEISKIQTYIIQSKKEKQKRAKSQKNY